MSRLYVIELGKTRIKVGHSAEPAKRLATHARAARAHGLEPGRQWIARDYGSGEHETALIKYCTSISKSPNPNLGEYFADVPFEVAVAYASHLPDKDAATEAAEEARQRVAAERRRTREWAQLQRIRRQRENGDRQHLTTREIAAELAVPASRIYQGICRGEIKHIRASGCIFIPASTLPAIRSWLDARQFALVESAS